MIPYLLLRIHEMARRSPKRRSRIIMKTALITTTVNVPTVLQLYRKLDPDVRFFVALERGKYDALPEFVESIPNAAWCVEGNYSCSGLIGWNTIARRNIALLEALKWGADVIVSIDDDNIPLPFFFWNYQVLFQDNFLFDGIKVSAKWFNSSMGHVVQRGYPQHTGPYESRCVPVTDAKIGVAQGIILGDPDTSAIDRISQHPEVHQVSELLRAGIVTDPRETYAPLNSQNICFIRELAPCFLMVPSYGRYDDIYASLVAQRIMRERALFVHYGQPFVWQSRNQHDPLKDLRAEQWGAEHIIEFASWLDGFLGQHDVIGMLKVMATNLPEFIPSGTQELWLAWLSDCEAVMK